MEQEQELDVQNKTMVIVLEQEQELNMQNNRMVGTSGRKVVTEGLDKICQFSMQERPCSNQFAQIHSFQFRSEPDDPSR